MACHPTRISRSRIPGKGGSHVCPELVLSEACPEPGRRVEGRSRRAAARRAWEPGLLGPNTQFKGGDSSVLSTDSNKEPPPSFIDSYLVSS